MNNIYDFCKNINMDVATTKEIVDFYNSHRAIVDNYVALFIKHPQLCNLRQPTKKIRLVVTILIAMEQHKHYVDLGIIDEIYYDTMSDITFWADDYKQKNNEIGLDNIKWIYNHLTLQLFKIGRLQFKMSILPYQFYHKAYSGAKRPKYFSQTISIHVPRGSALDYKECKNNIDTAKVFFKVHFPKYEYTCFWTRSWLLHPELGHLLPDGSNILKYRTLYDVVRYNNVPHDVFKYVWPGCDKNINKLPEDNSLRRNIKKHLTDGGKLGVGLGIIN